MVTAIEELVQALELDPEARSTQRAVHRLESERSLTLYALREVQSRVAALLEAVESDQWLATAQREAQTLGYTGVGTRWAEAEGRLAKIAGMIEVLG